ncbi:MAG TPA: tetratricopeptide repeat protein [Terriglobales bacterium]|nr:tetratricopeptide repeat protein [Terriglobales bacterium]
MISQLRLKAFVRRPPVVLASLLVLAMIGFGVVHRLVNRFGEQKKALGRHLFQQSQADLRHSRSDYAVDDLRAALDYNPGNFDYELTLARTLRDTGRTSEAESYLIGLWERDPQNSLVNLAIARLYARQKLPEKASQYYHNAIYGVWPSDAQAMRRETQLELIHSLLAENIYPQAQAELISWSSALPPDPNLHLTVAGLFLDARDYDHALDEYQMVLRHDRNSVQALAGAGESAYRLGRYRTAQRYLASGPLEHGRTPETTQLLETTNMILDANPYARRISSREVSRRVVKDFRQAGVRLSECMKEKNIVPESSAKLPSLQKKTDNDKSSATPAPPNDLAALYQRWLALKPKVTESRVSAGNSLRDSTIDATFEIEQQTATACGAPSGLDQALLLLSQNPTGAER